MARLVRPAAGSRLDYPADVERMRSVAAAAGYELDTATAVWAWETYSDTFSAGWLNLPEDDGALLQALFEMLVAVDG